MIRAGTRRLLLFVAVTLMVELAGGRAAYAQKPTFDLEGVVTDAQQAVLPGATVTIRNMATGLTRSTSTDENGRFVFASLPPEGNYTLQTELAGFATELRQDLVFNAGQRVVLNFSLKLSSVQETITVAGETPLVQTTNAEVSKTIDTKDLQTLPVAERNYFRLLTLDSNVVAIAPGTNGLNVGGGDVWNFGTYVDGTNNFSKWLTLQRAPQRGSSGFALETVKEVQIITNQFSAEFGGHSAGVMSMITKSGTNDMSGSAFFILRPGDLDALPPLATRKAPYDQQQFGGVVGGPLVRDRAFFFGSYEYRRERSNTVVTSPEAPGEVVPTPANEHQGHVRGDIRFTDRNALAVRYNMVRWKQDNETGGLFLPGTGYLWTNNVDTVQNTWTNIRSDRFLNEVRVQWSRYYDLRAAEVRLRPVQSFRLLGHRRRRDRHVGRDSRRHVGHLRHGLALARQSLVQARCVVHVRQDDAAVPAEPERHLLLCRQPRRGAAAEPVQPVVRDDARRRFPVSESVRVQRVRAGRLARPQQPDTQSGASLRRRGRERHSRLAGACRQEQHRPAHRLCLGSKERPALVDSRRLRPVHPAESNLHDSEGRRAGAERHRPALAAADEPVLPGLPEQPAELPAGSGAAAAQHPGDRGRSRERVRVAGTASASSTSSERGRASGWTTPTPAA